MFQCHHSTKPSFCDASSVDVIPEPLIQYHSQDLDMGRVGDRLTLRAERNAVIEAQYFLGKAYDQPCRDEGHMLSL